MSNEPRSMINKLLGFSLLLAVSTWLIAWSVATLRELLPAFIVIGGVVLAGVVLRWIIEYRRFR